jgi:antitoxin ParD1/3/4
LRPFEPHFFERGIPQKFGFNLRFPRKTARTKLLYRTRTFSFSKIAIQIRDTPAKRLRNIYKHLPSLRRTNNFPYPSLRWSTIAPIITPEHMGNIFRVSASMPTIARRGSNGRSSTSEVVREALRDWKMKRALQLRELAALQADIDKGLKNLAKGRVKDFNAGRIVKRGKALLRSRSRLG